MAQKVELHQLVDLSIDVQGGKSTVNFGLLNNLLHEMIKNMGLGNVQVVIESDQDGAPPPKEAMSIPSSNGLDNAHVQDDEARRTPELDNLTKQSVSFATASPTFDNASMGGGGEKLLGDLQDKVQDIEKKLSTFDNLVSDDAKVQHTESYIGDMWNFVNLGKRVDGCESGLEAHSKILDELRKGLKQLNDYKFYLDQLKDNSAVDLRQMINGLTADASEKTKIINAAKDRIKKLEDAKPDESLAQELAEKVKGLMALKDEIDGKLAGLPSMDDIENIKENFVTWIGLDEILRNYKPPRSPMPPSREGVEALARAGEIKEKTDELGNKIDELGKTVKTKVDTDEFEAKMEEAIKQKRPPSSRTEMARQRFTEAMQELAERIAMLEERPIAENTIQYIPHEDLPLNPHPVVPPIPSRESLLNTSSTNFAPIIDTIMDSSPSRQSRYGGSDPFVNEYLLKLTRSIENLKSAEFGGKSLPDDLKAQLEALQAGMADALVACEMIGAISQENETNKSAIADLNNQIEDLLDRYKILEDSIENMPKGGGSLDDAQLQALQDTIKSLQDEQEIHHNQLNKMNEENMQKDLHLKTLYSGVDDLREMKADKDFVAMEMEEKADKRAVDHKANRVFVDDHFDKLNSGLESALKRCQGQEEALKTAMEQITEDVDGKLDRMELQNVKDFLENRLSKLKGSAAPPPPPREEDADPAGMRRRLLKFHCISCDRPVEVNSGGMIPSALPVAYGFPGMRSNRPYTTYELELIRQHQRNLLHMKSDPYDMPPTSRSCGGQHTMTYAHRRTRISALSFQPKKASLNNRNTRPKKMVFR